MAMLIMATAFLFAFIGFADKAPGLGIFGLIAGFISLMVGVRTKAHKNE